MGSEFGRCSSHRDGLRNNQALLPRLRGNLLSLGVNDELLALFKGVHRYTWARNQLLIAQALPVIAALEQAGVATLLLKGGGWSLPRDRTRGCGR